MNDYSSVLRRVSEDTSRLRAGLIASNAIRNLGTIAGLPHVTDAMRVRGNVYVVGAGPSAPEGLSTVPVGSVIFCVNGSWQLLKDHGLKPSLVVSAESLNVREHMQGYDGPVALDWSSHPATFAWAGDRAMWFTDASPFAGRAMSSIDVPVIEYSNSAVCAAIELAFVCGASAVTLVGVDSCYPVGEDAYAKGSHWSGMGITREGGKLHFEKNEARERLHRLAGIPPIPTVRAPLVVNELDTVPEMLGQALWIKDRAARDSIFSASRYLIQLLSPSNVQPVALELLGSVHFCESPPRSDVIAIVRALERELELAESLASHVLDGTDLNLDALVNGMQFLQTLTVPDIYTLHHHPDASDGAKLRGTYTIMRAGVARARGLLSAPLSRARV